MQKLIDAIILATKRHSGQTRKDGSQYILHPLAVARMVTKAGYPEEYAIAAVLHDILEDTDTNEDEIAVFGIDVLEAVKLVTRPNGMDEGEYVSRILENEMASVVKNADKIHNLEDLPFVGKEGERRTNQKFTERYLAKSKKYYQGRFSKALDKALDEAERLLADPIVHERPEYEYSMEDFALYE